MLFSKFKILVFGIIFSIFISDLSPTRAFEIERVKGNCRPINCQLLLKDLKLNWQKQINEWLNSYDCQDKNILGLNVWEKDTKNLVVSFICWGKPDKTQKVYGNYLGILPFPKNENTFSSKWNCEGNINCENYLNSLKLKYPQRARNAEIQCGIKDGELRLLIEENQLKVQCVFSKGNIQIDINSDGVSDGEISKPTVISLTLYQFNLD